MKGRVLLTTGAIIAAAGPTGFENRRYEATVDRFLISEDGKKFVVLGKKYHYVFDMSEHFGAVLASSYRKSIKGVALRFRRAGRQDLGQIPVRTSPHRDGRRRPGSRAGGRLQEGRTLRSEDEGRAGRFALSGRRFRAGQDVVVICPCVRDSDDRQHHDGGQGRSRTRDARHGRCRRRDDGRGGGVVACIAAMPAPAAGVRSDRDARRHADLPDAATLLAKGKLPHRPLRDPRSQFGRLTVLPRPGQPFPRSLAQERGLFARPTPQSCVGGTGQAFGRLRNRTRRTPASVRLIRTNRFPRA